MKNVEDTIKLLKYLQENPKATQRELMRELGVSLGKVNYLINFLADRGLIKLKRFRKSNNKAAYLYKLTPKDIYEEISVARKHIKNKLAEYEELKAQIEIFAKSIGEKDINRS